MQPFKTACTHQPPPNPASALQICVADGRTDSEGTLYANACALKHCVLAAWITDATPRYDYLPLDCGSAVACSLMGRDVDRCRKVWMDQTTTSVLTDDSCACGLKRECLDRKLHEWCQCRHAWRGRAVLQAHPCQPPYSTPRPAGSPAKQCHEGHNGCLRCHQDGKRCRACRLGFRLDAAGVCKPCAVEACLSCPGSVNYCTVCASGYQRTANQKCVRA